MSPARWTKAPAVRASLLAMAGLGTLAVLAALAARHGAAQPPAAPPLPAARVAAATPAPQRVAPPASAAIALGASMPAPAHAALAPPPAADAAPCTPQADAPPAAADLASHPAAAQAATLLAEGQHQELAALATQAGDPITFALAWQACAEAPRAAACSQLRPEQWVQLEPDNAVAWLALADRAAEQGQDTAVAQALDRAAAAATARLHSYAASSLLSAAAHWQRRPWQPDEAMAAAWRLAEQRPALALPALQSHCEAASRALDAGRQWQCSAAASALLAGASELAVRAQAIELARSAGWPEQRLAPVVAEQEALEAVAGPPAQALNPAGCAAAWQLHAWARAQEAEGEVPQLRQLMNALGHPPALWRARRLKEWALAVATAAAAAAASSDGR